MRPHATNWDYFKPKQTSILKSFDGFFNETLAFFCCEERIHNNFRWMVKIIEDSKKPKRSSHFEKSLWVCLRWNILSALMRSAVVEDGLDDARSLWHLKTFPRYFLLRSREAEISFDVIEMSLINIVVCCWWFFFWNNLSPIDFLNNRGWTDREKYCSWPK